MHMHACIYGHGQQVYVATNAKAEELAVLEASGLRHTPLGATSPLDMAVDMELARRAVRVVLDVGSNVAHVVIKVRHPDELPCQLLTCDEGAGSSASSGAPRRTSGGLPVVHRRVPQDPAELWRLQQQGPTVLLEEKRRARDVTPEQLDDACRTAVRHVVRRNSTLGLVAVDTHYHSALTYLAPKLATWCGSGNGGAGGSSKSSNRATGSGGRRTTESV
jgi:hypothetical protein